MRITNFIYSHFEFLRKSLKNAITTRIMISVNGNAPMIDMLIICCVVESEKSNAIGSTMKITAQKILIFFDGAQSMLSFLYENADMTSVSASNVDAYSPIIVKRRTTNSKTEILDDEMSSTMQSAGLKP